MLNLMKPRVPKMRMRILDDVRGIQLSNAMKNMDVGDIRQRQVEDEEDDYAQVLSNSNVQVDTNQAISSS